MTESEKESEIADLKTGDSTRALLERAALELLEENGVLAGLNLREVAERAGVNRALVYHHFGSREELLRSALKRDLKGRLYQVSEGLSLPFNARVRQVLRTMVQHQPSLRLAFLLLLDSNEPVRFGPLKDEWFQSIEADVEQGEIASELDIEAFLVLISALSYGYALIRESIAMEIAVEPLQLDWRIDALLGKILQEAIEN